MTQEQNISSPAVDFSDMQGLIRFGYGRLKDAEFLLLKVRDVDAARSWISSAPISTAKWRDEAPKQAVQLALTPSGLAAFGMDEAAMAQFPQPFLAGMDGEDSRSRRLGDIGANAPKHWAWTGEQAHILLMLYAVEGGLDYLKAQLFDAQFEVGFETIRSMPTATNNGFEPFGFRDGISEPKIDWGRSHPIKKHGRSEYTNLISPGEVILGQGNEYRELSQSPHAGGTDLGIHGTYLVMRQMQQDVSGFWQYLDAASDGNDTLREDLATAMVGRARDGTPMIKSRTEIAGAHRENAFTYDGDGDGTLCPLGAHIRRSNPRNADHPHGVSRGWAWLMSTLGFRRRSDRLPGRHDLVASTRFHRLVRRGRVYGSRISPQDALAKDDKAERGLIFMCLCADIVRQFEFVQNAWIASPTFDGLKGEADPLLGGRDEMHGNATDGFTLQHPNGLGRKLESLPRFVTLRGGGYFFMPGISALRWIIGERE